MKINAQRLEKHYRPITEIWGDGGTQGHYEICSYIVECCRSPLIQELSTVRTHGHRRTESFKIFEGPVARLIIMAVVTRYCKGYAAIELGPPDDGAWPGKDHCTM